MKLLYVCECCDDIVDVVVVPSQPQVSSVSLTGHNQGDIIKTGSEGNEITLPTLCEDCRESLFGGPDNTFFSGPVLH